MSKPIYRTRITTKAGAYRTREFASSKNAISHAKQLANEGGTGYVQKEHFVAGMQRVEVIFHTDQHVETCSPALVEEAA
jgi:hypothetical protein